jgi:transposase
MEVPITKLPNTNPKTGVKTMVNILNHIQGKNGSRWSNFIKETGIENILILAIDAAKYTHKAMICNYFGDILVSPFDFDASLTGFEKIKTAVEKEKEKHDWKEVVVGIETTGHYYEDLVRRSQMEDYHVRIINAATTAKEREALLNWSKTDNLDLLAIVQSIIHGRGTSSEITSGSISNLRKLTRARRELVKEQTSTKNHIITHVDHIFREFQGKTVWIDGERKKLKPLSDLFGKSSRYLMRHCLHPSDILKLGAKGLRELSIQENLKLRDESIETLVDLAQHSISQEKEFLQADHFLLCQRLDQLELIEGQINKLEREIEDLFVQMDGAIILSVPGIGLVTGAELYAEMGDVSDFDHAGQLIKMAGTNPIVKQSGDRKPSYYAVSKQGRRPFRNVVYQIGRSLATNNPEMKQKYIALKERGKHPRQAYIALGNRMIRLAFSMIKYQTLYRTDESDYTLFDQINKKLYSTNRKKFYERFVEKGISQSA